MHRSDTYTDFGIQVTRIDRYDCLYLNTNREENRSINIIARIVKYIFEPRQRIICNVSVKVENNGMNF